MCRRITGNMIFLDNKFAINVVRVSTDNIGDMSCSPYSYFNFPFNLKQYDIHRPVKCDRLIFGGGGLQYFPNYMLRWMHLAKKNKKICSWGMGHNTHGITSQIWPEYMDLFDLHGIRDWGTKWNWVPCASCMHPAFGVKYEIKNEIAIYSHQEFPCNISDFPTMNNNVRTITEVIKFLGQAEIIITNSYHGAYWGILLGRKVVIYNPFSSRFYNFKHQPKIVTKDNWQQEIKNINVFPEALSECKQANIQHYNRVLELFS